MTEDRLQVLIVDDEESIRVPLQEFLVDVFGYRVDAVASGQEAIGLVEQHQGNYDVALIDQLLVPGPDGIAVMQEIKSRWPDMECIILTGWGTESRQRALEGGAFRYLQKPFERNELAMLIRTAGQQVRLRAISRNILAELDLEPMLVEILAAARSLGLADEAAVVLRNADTDQLEVHPPLKDGHPVWHRHFRDRDLTRDVIKFGKVISVPDVANDERINHQLVESGICSFIGVPIPGESGNLGVLYVYSHEQGQFDNWGTVALLQTLAGQAGQGIANARTFETTQMRGRYMEALVVMGQGLTRTTSRREQLVLAWDFVRSQFHVSTFLSALYDHDADTLRFPLVIDKGALMTISERHLGDDSAAWGLSGYVVKTGSEFYAPTTPDRQDRCLTLGIVPTQIDEPCESCFFLPLTVGDQVIGVLSFQSYASHAFSPIMRDAMRALGSVLAVALENARLWEESQRGQQLLAALDEASLHIRAIKDPDLLLHETIRQAVQLVDCQVGALFINYEGMGELELAAVYGLPSHLRSTRHPHTEGLIGQVTRSGQKEVIPHYNTWPQRDVFARDEMIKTAIGVPIKQTGKVEAVLFIGETQGNQTFPPHTREILDRLVAQAAIALQTSQLIGQEQRIVAQLYILHRINDFIQTTRDLEMILHVALTGITAGYGLGFNRAVLLMLDDDQRTMTGRIGIGEFDEQKVRDAWQQSHDAGLNEFDRYVVALEAKTLQPTPVDSRIRRMVLSLGEYQSNAFLEVVQEKKYRLVSEQEWHSLPTPFVEAFEPALPLIIVPLLARGRVFGVVVADNKVTRSPITRALTNSLITFVNTAAVAIDNAQLFDDANTERERLRAYYQASSALVSSLDLDQVLKDIVNRACSAAQATGVCMVMIDTGHQVQSLLVAGAEEPTDFAEVVRDKGLSIEVMRTGLPAIVEDSAKEQARLNPSPFWRSVGAALCLPVMLEGRRLGVMWFYYDQPRRFSRVEIDAAQLFVNQAAIAHHSARRMMELEQMRRAAETMSRSVDVLDTLQIIAASAAAVLQAHSTAIWPFDDVIGRFIPEELATAGIPLTEVEKLRADEPQRGRTAERVMSEGYLQVVDIMRTDYDFIGQTSRDLLLRLDVRSFQGVPLRVGDETLGVLYANFKRPHVFGEEDEIRLKTFANHAALALKNSRLLAQLQRTRRAANVIADVTVRADLTETLHTIASHTRPVLGADVVTIYAFEERTQHFTRWATDIVSPRRPDSVRPSTQLTMRSVVWRILALEKAPYTYMVEKDIAQDELLSGYFVTAEEIAATIAVQLRVGERRVGVMFVNYRTNHRFTEDEISTVRLFADQAAVAIVNAQLYEETLRRADALQSVYNAGKAITSSHTLPETLDQIVQQALGLMKNMHPAHCFGHLALKSGHRLWFAAASSPEILQRLQHKVGQIDLETSARAGITGRAARAGIVQNVGDVREDLDYITLDDGTYSELAVPIKLGNRRVIGVLSIEHPVLDAFRPEDVTAVENLAAQAAIAIQNARLLEQGQIVARISREAAQQLEFDAFVHTLFGGVKDVFDSHRVPVYLNLATYDSSQNTLALHPTRFYPETNIFGEFPVTDRGIMAHVARTRSSHYAPDVAKDSHYREMHHGTRSEFAVPIIFGGQLLGVFDLESTLRDAFTPEDRQLVHTLADQVATTMRNVSQYEELTRTYEDLRRTRRQMTARTALAWVNMASGVWRHAMVKHAITIKEQAQLLQSDWGKPADKTEIQQGFAMITRLADQIMQRPIAEPLSSTTGLRLVSPSGLVADRVKQLKQYGTYPGVDLQTDLQVQEASLLRVNPEWIRSALDILIDNAVDAVKQQSTREVVVGTRAGDAGIEIFVEDTGPGLPVEVVDKLGLESIEKPEDAQGLGMGLLMARMIVQTYGGDIRVAATSSIGTTMAICLPLAS